jgi:hypothetical protein
MGWEYRDGKQYYYRKRREGDRVISEYVGGSAAGLFVSARDAEDRWQRIQDRAELREQKAATRKLDEQINEAEKLARAMTRAVLLLSGYHAPRRQWRKLRQ